MLTPLLIEFKKLNRSLVLLLAVAAPGLAQDLDTPAQREDWRARSSLGPKDPAE